MLCKLPNWVPLCWTTLKRSVDQSRVGFAAEDYRIKTKFRTRLARARNVLRAYTEYANGSIGDRECMEARYTKIHECHEWLGGTTGCAQTRRTILIMTRMTRKTS